MKAVKKDVFDINKVTVVGSPTITSDGIFISNNTNTATNLAITPKFDFSKHFTVEVEEEKLNADSRFEGFTVTSTTVNNVLFGVQYRTDNSFYLIVCTDTMHPVQSISYSHNNITKIKYKISWDGNVYSLSVKDMDIVSNWVVIATYESSDIVTRGGSSQGGINFGWHGNSGKSMPNKYDLTKTFFIIDNKLVYTPTKPTYLLERRKEGFDLSKFTVVGTPTITSDGVYTCGYDKTSYVKVPFDNTLDSFSLDVEINIQDTSQTGYYLGHSNNISYGFMDANFNGGGATDFRIRVKDGDENVSKLEMGASNYRVGTEKINLTFTGTQYILTRTRADGVVYTKTVDSTFKPATNFFSLGNSNKENVPCPTINLTKITNTVDGKEVFTGAKEKFYAIGD